MGKRKSITGVKKKRARPASENLANSRTRTATPAPLASPAPENALRPRELLSMRETAPNESLPTNRARKQPALKARVKLISQSTIRSKWTVLDEAAQAKAATIFRSIELPVLARHALEWKKVEAYFTLASLTKMLTKRLPKMPFPPRTKELHFDYDALVKSNRTLQQRLTGSAKTIFELRNELGKQKLALATEKKELEDLERSVKSS